MPSITQRLPSLSNAPGSAPAVVAATEGSGAPVAASCDDDHASVSFVLFVLPHQILFDVAIGA